jgi:hypothetical protein
MPERKQQPRVTFTRMQSDKFGTMEDKWCVTGPTEIVRPFNTVEVEKKNHTRVIVTITEVIARIGTKAFATFETKELPKSERLVSIEATDDGKGFVLEFLDETIRVSVEDRQLPSPPSSELFDNKDTQEFF